jgi:hypothetical protein
MSKRLPVEEAEKKLQNNMSSLHREAMRFGRLAAHLESSRTVSDADKAATEAIALEQLADFCRKYYAEVTEAANVIDAAQSTLQ